METPGVMIGKPSIVQREVGGQFRNRHERDCPEKAARRQAVMSAISTVCVGWWESHGVRQANSGVDGR